MVVTAWPACSRVKKALQAIQQYLELELQIVLAPSAMLDRYGSAAGYIRKDGFEISAKVFNVLEGLTIKGVRGEKTEIYYKKNEI